MLQIWTLTIEAQDSARTSILFYSICQYSQTNAQDSQDHSNAEGWGHNTLQTDTVLNIV